MNIKSSQVIYSEHDYDECFEYKDGSGRVPDGVAVGYLAVTSELKQEYFYLFDDVQYSNYDHDYWNNLELENDVDRVVLG